METATEKTATRVLKLSKAAAGEPVLKDLEHASDNGASHGLDKEALIGIYRTMYISRRIDDKEIQLKGQNKIFFQISGAGHEGILVGAGAGDEVRLRLVLSLLSRPRSDAAAGNDAEEMLHSAVGAEADPNSHGRQMPSHWGSVRLNVPSQSSPTGTQALHAVGAAEATYRASLVKEMQDKITRF